MRRSASAAERDVKPRSCQYLSMNVMLLANLKDTIPSLFAACSKHACITILISKVPFSDPGMVDCNWGHLVRCNPHDGSRGLQQLALRSNAELMKARGLVESLNMLDTMSGRVQRRDME
jgi:hypothetical protein